jgi:hypothetical protein
VNPLQAVSRVLDPIKAGDHSRPQAQTDMGLVRMTGDPDRMHGHNPNLISECYRALQLPRAFAENIYCLQ